MNFLGIIVSPEMLLIEHFEKHISKPNHVCYSKTSPECKLILCLPTISQNISSKPQYISPDGINHCQTHVNAIGCMLRS